MLSLCPFVCYGLAVLASSVQFASCGFARRFFSGTAHPLGTANIEGKTTNPVQQRGLRGKFVWFVGVGALMRSWTGGIRAEIPLKQPDIGEYLPQAHALGIHLGRPTEPACFPQQSKNLSLVLSRMYVLQVGNPIRAGGVLDARASPQNLSDCPRSI